MGGIRRWKMQIGVLVKRLWEKNEGKRFLSRVELGEWSKRE